MPATSFLPFEALPIVSATLNAAHDLQKLRSHRIMHNGTMVFKVHMQCLLKGRSHWFYQILFNLQLSA